MLLVGGSALLSFLFAATFGAAPLLICWTGIGPAPEPQTSSCLARKINELAPFDRLTYDEPYLRLLILSVVAFAVLIGGALAVRRLTSR